jgi:anti-sigma regulatory factor (Ser/Thr protein kinase)
MQKNLKIESNIGNLRVVENAIDDLTNEAGISQDSYGKILVSTLEAVNNAIIHGNKSDINKLVKIEFVLKDNNLEVTVTDEGQGFKPSEIPDPTRPENIESLDGRGIFLMSKLADDIKYNKKGNRVKMIFKI